MPGTTDKPRNEYERKRLKAESVAGVAFERSAEGVGANAKY